MTVATLPSTTNPFEPAANLPGAPVVADEDLPKEKKNKKDKKDKKDKKSKKPKKDKKEGTPADDKPIRQAVGVIVIDPATQKVLMLESSKRVGAYVLPRDDCQTGDEHPEKAAIRLLHDKAGVSTSFLSTRIGSFTEANKKGKIVAQHWMYEVHAPTLLEAWPNSGRQRVWVPYEDALKATEKKRMSVLALQKCSLHKKVSSV